MPELFFDVETTGLFPRNASYMDLNAFKNSRMVSIAWILRNEETVLSQKYYIVKNEVETGEIGAEKIHGINRNMVNEYGRPVLGVLDDFLEDLQSADRLIAHNFDFDSKIVMSELYRLGLTAEIADFKNKPKICTMKSTTEFCAIKNKYGSYKWPRLQELFEKLFGEQFENAHNALADVQATVDCYYELVNLNEDILTL